jgi:hypothetical protein
MFRDSELENHVDHDCSPTGPGGSSFQDIMISIFAKTGPGYQNLKCTTVQIQVSTTVHRCCILSSSLWNFCPVPGPASGQPGLHLTRHQNNIKKI